jgi:hypothetical protein
VLLTCGINHTSTTCGQTLSRRRLAGSFLESGPRGTIRSRVSLRLGGILGFAYERNDIEGGPDATAELGDRTSKICDQEQAKPYTN